MSMFRRISSISGLFPVIPVYFQYFRCISSISGVFPELLLAIGEAGRTERCSPKRNKFFTPENDRTKAVFLRPVSANSSIRIICHYSIKTIMKYSRGQANLHRKNSFILSSDDKWMLIYEKENSFHQPTNKGIQKTTTLISLALIVQTFWRMLDFKVITFINFISKVQLNHFSHKCIGSSSSLAKGQLSHHLRVWSNYLCLWYVNFVISKERSVVMNF